MVIILALHPAFELVLLPNKSYIISQHKNLSDHHDSNQINMNSSFDVHEVKTNSEA